MSDQKKRLSMVRVLWTDYPAFYSTFAPLVAWTVILAWVPDWRGAGPVIQAGARPFFYILAGLVTVVGGLVLSYRLWIFFHTFHAGIQLRGKISRVELKRDRGWVEYAYIFDHKEYLSGAPIHRTAKTRALKPGEHVTLIIDPAKPRRAFILDLYTAD